MGKKNAELCEFKYCRNAWTHLACGCQFGHPWTLKVCDLHAKDYATADGKDSTGRLVRLTARITPENRHPEVLHDQDWRDHQPTLDPDINPTKFKAALQQAKQKIAQKPIVLETPTDHPLAKIYSDPKFLADYRADMRKEREKLGLPQPHTRPNPTTEEK